MKMEVSEVLYNDWAPRLVETCLTRDGWVGIRPKEVSYMPFWVWFNMESCRIICFPCVSEVKFLMQSRMAMRAWLGCFTHHTGCCACRMQVPKTWEGFIETV